MIKADVHVHTNFSPDSKTEVCDQIEKAIDSGFHSICITDHYDIIYLHENLDGDQFVFNTEDYLKKLADIKEKYKDKIDVLIGVEMGLFSHLETYVNEYLNKYNFDFIIGSSHFVGSLEPGSSNAFWKDRSEKEAILNYFESALENVKIFNNYDVYGHLDYVVRYTPSKSKDFKIAYYEDVITEILKNIIKNGQGIEINTGDIDNLGRTNPHKDILKMYKKLGGEIITIGSDAHEPEHLGHEFKIAEDLMKEIGFKYYAVYKNRTPQFYKI